MNLGLVVVENAGLLLTDAGLELARELTPLLDGDGDDPLNDRQREILTERLLAIPPERNEIAAFLHAVEETGGVQSEVDKRLAERHQAWTEAQVISLRAALIGRLRDLQVIDVITDSTGTPSIVFGPSFVELKKAL